MVLSETANKIAQMKYSINNETYEAICLRVASYIAEVEKNFGKDEAAITQTTNEFFQVIYNQYFIPGGRILANAGTGIKNLMNCFVLPIEDSRSSIYQSLKDAAEIFAWGGGVGYNFSHVREAGSDIKTTGGKASGPLSFMSLFDQTGEVIQQASRRGAQMGMLSINHKDIEAFIDFKATPNPRNLRVLEEYDHNLKTVDGRLKNTKYYDVLQKTLLDDQLSHFNISVIVDSKFMSRAERDILHYLPSIVSDGPTEVVSAKALLEKIAKQAWTSGDPGLFFIDKAEEDNMVPYIGKIDCTNPCFVGSTKILTLDGPKTFKELADMGKDVIVYSWDKTTKLPILKTMRSPKVTRKNAELVEVKFSSGLTVKCTPDHNFISFRGNKIQAKNLKPGQAIRAFSMSEHRDGHYRVHGWVNGKTTHQYLARLVWEFYNGSIPTGMIVHHKDGDVKNNTISNLELLSPIEHNRVHYPKRLFNGFYHDEDRNIALARNHKVISVTKLNETQDVYNGIVDDTHTYIVLDDQPIHGIYSGIVSANCGEVPLLPYEACCLGSINLSKFYDHLNKTIDWQSMEEVVRLATRFMDNVQEVSYTPLDKINNMTKGLRRLGLGVMGWADLLAKMEIPYNSESAYKLAEYISWFVSFFSWLESIELAKERGPFKYYDPEKVNLHVVEKVLNSEFNPYKFDIDEIRKTGLRNVSVTSIAPTGTIALLANVNSAIEPYFALAYRRHITEGVGNIAKDTLIEINPVLFEKLKEHLYSEDDITEIKEYIIKHGTLKGCPKIHDNLSASFYTSHDLSWQEHLRMQTAWQKYITNAVSKTINMRNSSTVEDVEQAYMEAWKQGAKGITIYRDNSRMFQILNVGTS